MFIQNSRRYLASIAILDARLSHPVQGSSIGLARRRPDWDLRLSVIPNAAPCETLLAAFVRPRAVNGESRNAVPPACDSLRPVSDLTGFSNVLPWPVHFHRDATGYGSVQIEIPAVAGAGAGAHRFKLPANRSQARLLNRGCHPRKCSPYWLAARASEPQDEIRDGRLRGRTASGHC